MKHLLLIVTAIASLSFVPFQNKEYVEGIIAIVEDIGLALKTNFPYVSRTDKNELPDDIVFGK